MCEANVYLTNDNDSREELLLEAVDLVEPLEADQWRLVSIFGEQKVVRAKIKRMVLAEHKIFLEPVG
ncbi:MAG: CooT family nickel-binding protein [Deltaproteobacteria bacterium]|nr:CooT family nickel-binding protein [Deltaproteobacteria bacterium]